MSRRPIDKPIAVTVLGLVLAGLVMVWSATAPLDIHHEGDGYSFLKKQIAYAAIGLGAWAATIRYARHSRALELRNLWLGYGLVVGAVLLTQSPLGHGELGARR